MARNVDLNRMQIFKHVVASGSFSKAAEMLHQPKSRISRNISSLEKELGVQLIYRTTRQFRLTDAGRELYNRALPALNDLAQALEKVSDHSTELSGILRVTAPEDLGVVLVGDICRAFMEIHPRVQVDLHLTSQVMDLVKDSIDVAIRIGKLKDSSLRQKKFGRIKMGFFANTTLAIGVNKLEGLEKLPFLAFSPGRTGKIKVSNGKSQRSLKFSPIFTSNNYLVLRSLAVQGLGMTLLPIFLVKDELRQGSLVRLCADWGTEEVPIQVVLPQQREPLPRVTRFVDFVSAQLAPYFT